MPYASVGGGGLAEITVITSPSPTTRSRVAITWIATTGGIPGDMVRDLMIEAIESRFGEALLQQPIEWLTDNGSPYIARDTRSFAREIGLEPLTTAIGVGNRTAWPKRS